MFINIFSQKIFCDSVSNVPISCLCHLKLKKLGIYIITNYINNIYFEYQKAEIPVIDAKPKSSDIYCDMRYKL